GVEVGPMVLMGFSQGGAMGTHLLGHFTTRGAGGEARSGFTVPGEIDTDADLPEARTPVVCGADRGDPSARGAASARARPSGPVPGVRSGALQPHVEGVSGRARDQRGGTGGRGRVPTGAPR